MAVSAFSEDGKYYSNISKDGRLRIWDTETNVLKQEYTPNLHLSSPPSCLQWLSVTNTAGSPQKGAKRKQSVSEAQFIALGTTNGKILMYSVTQAKVENVISDEKSGFNQYITALDWRRNYGLFSCNKAGFVYEWDLNSGKVRNKYKVTDGKNKQGNSVSSIKIVPHNQKTQAKYLVTSSWQVCVWRLLKGESTVVRQLGHNTSAGALLTVAQLENSCWLIEGSQTERLLSFWDITVTDEHLPQLNGNGDDSATPNKRQRRKSVTTSTPSYNFVLEDAPKFVDVDVRAEGDGNMLRLAAATRSGVVHYYGHMLNGASAKPIKPSVTVQVTTAEACPLPLLACRLTGAELTLAYTDGPAVVFEKISPDTSSKTQVLIRGESKPARKKNKTNDANKVRGEPERDVTYVEPMGGVTRKRNAPGGEVEVPMEARLENLSLEPRGRGKAAVGHNLTKLLVQGLHSKDKSLILTVLQKDDPLVAAQTVSGLPAGYVPMLMEQLADMATRKTSQCASVCSWLAATLKAHSALLLATTNSRTSNHLTQLLALFTYRRSHLCQLLNLKGRLELTGSQRAARDESHDAQPAVLEYNDTSSDEEMELEQYQSDSAASWSDDAEAAASSDED
ncbi:WD repeat-containing protein 43 isoform X1 [Ostrinia nubilalis]|uniref:WD repeat-containing protein 43 isoform X1 n=1 Tax=Ostrinia nubilalis TaxID=29057 RepID=UPI0030824740